jgi:signal transduction histidine kinase
MNLDRKTCCYAAAGLFLAIYFLVSVFAKEGPGLLALGDVIRLLLPFLAIFILGRHLAFTRGREKAFWALMTLGAALWFVPQVWRIWYDVVLKTPRPEPSLSHIFLFLHSIPLMAALALRPHHRRNDGELRTDFLDAVMLLFWWIYLYLFMVMPWRVAEGPISGIADFYFKALYLVENVALAAAAGFLFFFRPVRAWNRIYGRFFLYAAVYAAGSSLVDLQLFHLPYSGSIANVPVVAAMFFFVGIGLQETPSPSAVACEPPPTDCRALTALLALLALISMPAMALWVIYFSQAPAAVTVFRLKVTLAAIIALTLLVMLKQMLLNAELARLLRESQEIILHEKHLQDHLVSSEKMAALGQLVAGAAHEINNPLTAILGYADLLGQNAALGDEPRSLVQKIGQQARRTKRLVENLLSFAQQTPAEKTSVHINALLNNVLQLREPDLTGKKVRLKVRLEPELPRIRGNSNQLLQVFLHMMNNAVDALQEVGGGLLTIATASEDGWVVIKFSDTGSGVKEPQKIFDPFYTTKPVGKGAGLGLSACYGIVQDHGGKIECQNDPQGGATFMISLPAEAGAAENPPVA